MCEWGTYERCEVTIPAELSHTGARRSDTKPIDACIAPLIRALNAAGVVTISSCCGHGRQPAEISLDDGTELVRLADGWWWSVSGRAAEPTVAAFDRVLCGVPENIRRALGGEHG